MEAHGSCNMYPLVMNVQLQYLLSVGLGTKIAEKGASPAGCSALLAIDQTQWSPSLISWVNSWIGDKTPSYAIQQSNLSLACLKSHRSFSTVLTSSAFSMSWEKNTNMIATTKPTWVALSRTRLATSKMWLAGNSVKMGLSLSWSLTSSNLSTCLMK